MAKRQGFGVPPELSEEMKLFKKYFNYLHYVRKHVYNAEPNSRGGCSIFTLTLDEINDVVDRPSKMENLIISKDQELSSKRYLNTKSGLVSMVKA